MTSKTCYIQRSIGTAPGIAGPHLEGGKLGRLKPGLIMFLLCLICAGLGLRLLLILLAMIPLGLYFEINMLVNWSFKL